MVDMPVGAAPVAEFRPPTKEGSYEVGPPYTEEAPGLSLLCLKAWRSNVLNANPDSTGPDPISP